VWSEAGLLDLSSSGRVAVAGSDRTRFLNALLTSDVASLAIGAAQPSALVSATGKLIADFLVVRREDEFLLETAPERAAAAIATLRKHVIADDVEVVDARGAWEIVSVQGPLAGHVLARACGVRAGELPARSLECREVAVPDADSERPGRARGPGPSGGALVVVRHDRFGPPGFDVWAPAGGAAAALRERVLACGLEHGLRAAGRAAHEALRVAAGRAAWGREIDEDCFPQEVGLASAISTTKGCYMGQEVLARIHFQGHVNRVLARLALDRLPEEIDAARGAAPGAPPSLLQDGVEVGRLTSAARGPDDRALGLAVVRREGAEPGAAYDARLAGGAGLAATILSLAP
jgi:aminomethyltransferase